jgi:hypothetical protein
MSKKRKGLLKETEISIPSSRKGRPKNEKSKGDNPILNSFRV